jgi:branched-chain amino acid aminotransferase
VTDHAELNGRRVEAVPVKLLRATAYGHFSSMQIRDRRVRGLDLHLERLDRSTEEMFGLGLDRSRVRDHLSHAVRDIRDASVRVTVFGDADVLIHDRRGQVSEASIWNICFVTGDTVVWPSAPALPGITMQLVQAGLGSRSQHRPVSLTDLGGFEAAYLTNSIDPALPVASIDELRYADRPDLRSQVLAAYESNPWDPL